LQGNTKNGKSLSELLILTKMFEENAILVSYTEGITNNDNNISGEFIQNRKQKRLMNIHVISLFLQKPVLQLLIFVLQYVVLDMD
jgi:hypothetical protein